MPAELVESLLRRVSVDRAVDRFAGDVGRLAGVKQEAFGRRVGRVVRSGR
jgi:hypothetical protein